MTDGSKPKRVPSPWPIVIGFYFAIVIVSIAVFIAWAVGQDMDLVRKDYYAQEIQFQDHLDRVNRTQQMNQKPRINYDAGNDTILLSMNKPAFPTLGRIHLYRPSDAALDQQVKLALNAEGTQRIDARRCASGLWKVQINWTAGTNQFSSETTLILNRRKS